MPKQHHMRTRIFTNLTLILFFSFISSVAMAQIVISGKVLDEEKKPVAFAAVSIKGTYDGASTNENGEYTFKTTKKGNAVLYVNYLGFEPQNIDIVIADQNIVLNVGLKEKSNEQNTVVITAGAFEARKEPQFLNQLTL
jgi:vitamin B12 transporter